MRPCHKLPHLALMYEERINRLVAVLAASAATPSNRRLEAASFVTLEAVNAWEMFVRSYCLSIIMGARSASGALAVATRQRGADPEASLRIVFSVANPGKAIPTNVTHRDEPDWYDRQVLIMLSSHLAFSNASSVGAALRLPEADFRDMRTMRNFFAHKSESTADKVRRLSRRRGLLNLRSPHFAVLQPLAPARRSLAEQFLKASVQAAKILAS